MTVTQDLDIWTLILNASVVVKVVMFLLLAVSFMSWMFIFQKWFSIRRANGQTDKFERDFWSGNDLNSLYQGAVNNRHSIGSLERVFEAGFAASAAPKRATWSTARAAPCAPPSSARWISSSAICRFSPPRAR
jgi:biopolymer transport protein ExbB/TolQ